MNARLNQDSRRKTQDARRKTAHLTCARPRMLDSIVGSSFSRSFFQSLPPPLFLSAVRYLMATIHRADIRQPQVLHTKPQTLNISNVFGGIDPPSSRPALPPFDRPLVASFLPHFPPFLPSLSFCLPSTLPLCHLPHCLPFHLPLSPCPPRCSSSPNFILSGCAPSRRKYHHEALAASSLHAAISPIQSTPRPALGETPPRPKKSGVLVVGWLGIRQ